MNKVLIIRFLAVGVTNELAMKPEKILPTTLLRPFTSTLSLLSQTNEMVCHNEKPRHAAKKKELVLELTKLTVISKLRQ